MVVQSLEHSTTDHLYKSLNPDTTQHSETFEEKKIFKNASISSTVIRALVISLKDWKFESSHCFAPVENSREKNMLKRPSDVMQPLEHLTTDLLHKYLNPDTAQHSDM